MKNKRKTFSWINAPLVEVRSTKKYGQGVFARRTIPVGTLLMVFGGYVLTRKEEDQLPERIRDVGIMIDRDLVMGITSTAQLSDTDYVNHSCNPSAGIKGQISLVAMRSIRKDEEITFDYGTVLYRAKKSPKYELACSCGSTNCRGKITQSDWKLPSLQKKYRGFFPYYIQEEINASVRKHRKT